jgi:hypothetical protein
MVQEYDLVDQSITLDTTTNGIRNIWFDGTYYYVAESIPITDLVYIYRYDANWANKTTVYSNNLRATIGFDGINISIPAISFINSAFHVIVGFYSGMFWKFMDIESATGNSGTWSESVLLNTLDDVTSDTVQIFYIGATKYLFFYSGSGDSAVIVDPAIPAAYTDTGRTGIISGAYCDGTDIYWLSYKSSDTSYKIRKWNVTDGFRDESTPSFTGGADLEPATSQLWKNGTAWVVGWKNNLFWKESSTWYAVSVTTAANPAPHWYYSGGVLTVPYFTYANRMVILGTDNVAIRQLSISHSCAAAWNDYILDTDKKIWKLDLTPSDRFIEFIPKHVVEDAPIAQFKSTGSFIDNEYVALYDDSDTLIHAGEAKNITTQNGISEGTVKSLLDIDLDREITYTGSAETIATLFSNIITTYFKYGSAGTLTSAATTYNWNFQTRKVRDIFSEAAHIEGRIWYSTITLVIQLNAGTIDSTKTFKSSDGKYPASISKTTNNQKIGVVTGYGAAGISYTYTKDASNGLITLHLPSLALTALTAYVTKYADLENATQTQYTLTYLFGLLPLQVGQQLTFEYVLGDYNITSALFYIKEIEYDALDNYILKIVLHDVMLFKKTQLSTQQVFAYAREIDAAKPTATLDTSTDLDGASASDSKVPSQKAVKTYADTKVSKTGDQTIAGVKTFSSFPITPSSAPTTDYQVANKAYADTKVTGAGTVTDNAIVRFDGTTGKSIQNTACLIDDNNYMWLNRVYMKADTAILYFHNASNTENGSVHHDNSNMYVKAKTGNLYLSANNNVSYPVVITSSSADSTINGNGQYRLWIGTAGNEVHTIRAYNVYYHSIYTFTPKILKKDFDFRNLIRNFPTTVDENGNEKMDATKLPDEFTTRNYKKINKDEPDIDINAPIGLSVDQLLSLNLKALQDDDKRIEDNQNWAVRHIRALEAQVKELSESILVLQKKVLS